jgi:type II secretory pathway pseudopilin PulG
MGFSLLEAVVGLAILTILGAGIGQLATSSRLVATDSKQMVGIGLIKKNTTTFLSLANGCDATLGGLPADGIFRPIEIFRGVGKSYLKAGGKQEGWNVL